MNYIIFLKITTSFQHVMQRKKMLYIESTHHAFAMPSIMYGCELILFETVKPYFLEPPSDTTVLAGWPVSLKWRVYGNPEPIVYWYRGDRILEENHDDG